MWCGSQLREYSMVTIFGSEDTLHVTRFEDLLHLRVPLEGAEAAAGLTIGG